MTVFVKNGFSVNSNKYGVCFIQMGEMVYYDYQVRI